jgi:hypothetical protein
MLKKFAMARGLQKQEKALEADRIDRYKDGIFTRCDLPPEEEEIIQVQRVLSVAVGSSSSEAPQRRLWRRNSRGSPAKMTQLQCASFGVGLSLYRDAK